MYEASNAAVHPCCSTAFWASFLVQASMKGRLFELDIVGEKAQLLKGHLPYKFRTWCFSLIAMKRKYFFPSGLPR